MPEKRDRKLSSARKKTTMADPGKHAEKKQPAPQVRGAGKPAPAKVRLETETAVAAGITPLVDLGIIWERIGKARVPEEFRVSCIRPDDLLVCDFIFENLRIESEGEGGPKLVRKNPAAAVTLIIELPPQSFGEEAFLDKTGPEVASNPTGKDKFPETTPSADAKNVASAGETLPPMPSARIRMAGRSRIAYVMPAEETELAFTIEAILDACRRWPMRLDVNAVPDPPHFRLKDFGVSDQWLANVAASDGWAQATQELVGALGGAQALQKSLAGAARRVATKAIEAVSAGTRGIEGGLRRAMNEELDVLAERFAPLRDADRREVAAAALSLTTTQAVAARRVGESIIDRIKDFPFLPIIFGPHRPARDVTALELPYRVVLSPVPQSRWHHGTKPIARNGRTELWHTRLTSAIADIGPDLPTNVRALWSPDYHLNNIVGIVNDVKPFRMSLDPLDREMLVKLMSGFDELDKNGRTFRPHTARSRRLALSSLGALLDAEGNWEPPSPKDVSLEEWRHLATLGRDHYVRVVYRGFLKDLRHAASLVKVTERKFESIQGTKNRVAVLRQRFFIIVREPIKHYTGAGHTYGGRNFPFTDVEILTRVTPSLRAPDQPECRLSDPGTIIYNPATPGVPHRACFWPMISPTNNFLFQIAATDLSGNRVTFRDAVAVRRLGSER